MDMMQDGSSHEHPAEKRRERLTSPALDGMDGEIHVAIQLEENHHGQAVRPGSNLRWRHENSNGKPAEPMLTSIMGMRNFPERLEDYPSIMARFKKLAEEDRKEFSRVDEDVWRSFGEHEVLEASFDRQFDRQRTFGESAADMMAAVGGSWHFVFGFFSFIVVWAILNLSLPNTWDPYPFILLNLFLSTLAAFQAPVIMMSQNRQAERDRMQSDYTARVNLRAELFSRHTHAKLEAFINSAWRRLLEGQAIQTALLERLIETQRHNTDPSHHHHHHHAGHPHDPHGPRTTGACTTKGVHKAPPHDGPSSMGSSMGGGSRPPRFPGSSGRATPPRPSSTSSSPYYARSPAPPSHVAPESERAPPAVHVYESSSPSPLPLPSPPPSSPPPAPSSSPAPPPPGELLDAFSTPLASLCLAPPSARLFPGVELPWYLESEHDDHLIFLLRSLMRAPMDADERLLVFEHRLANFGDNFYGLCNNVTIEARESSFAAEGVLALSVPSMRPPSSSCSSSPSLHGPTQGRGRGKGRTVSPAYVSLAVHAASIVDTGAGAEPWMPFDVCYDLEFTQGAVLDSVFAGEGFVSLRNALDLPSMTATGSIKRLVLHPRGCPCSTSAEARRLRASSFSSVLSGPSSARAHECPMAISVTNGELPPRMKPSVSTSRQDRIADFWKAPLARIEVSYAPAPIFACVTLREGQAAWPLAVDFRHHHQKPTNGSAALGYSTDSPPKAGAFPPAPTPHPMEKTLSRRSFQSILDISSSALSHPHSTKDVSSSSSSSELPAATGPSTHSMPAPLCPPIRRNRLFVTLNPSSETLCSGLALGIEAPADAGGRNQDEIEGHGRVERAVTMQDVKNPGALPHDVWIEVPLVREAVGWQVRMPCELVGPAALFFYSPDGSIRIRGVLRDDGIECEEGEGGGEGMGGQQERQLEESETGSS